ncbi:MAG: serine hydrolase [Oscillospiraceae bacterium]|jgi:D-alanyl-D-alanine carboxypeptidase (penicillin-binding protein 5/6)|nr:serine hydrolase [Oscillospiraceae bacterium]
MKKSKIWAFFLVLALFLCEKPPSARAAQPEPIATGAAFLGEITTGTTLYAFDADARYAPDSLTKIMTLLLCAEAYEKGAVNLQTKITASDTSWFDITTEYASLGIMPGESMTFVDLIHCAYVGGSMSACNVLAEHIGGGVGYFVEMMNERAAELTCRGTHFVNPSGIAHDDQYTTARDMFLITREAVSHELFLQVARVTRYTALKTNLSLARTFTSVNFILQPANTRYYYEYAVAGQAGGANGTHSCVEYAARDGLETIVVILGASSPIQSDRSVQMTGLIDARRLLAWGSETYGWRAVLSASANLESIPVAYGKDTDSVALRPERDVTLLLENEVPDSAIGYETLLYARENGEALAAPVRMGDVLGEVALTLDGREIARVKLVAESSVPMLRLRFFEDQLGRALGHGVGLYLLLALAALLLLYAAMVLRYGARRRQERELVESMKRQIIEERRNGEYHRGYASDTRGAPRENAPGWRSPEAAEMAEDDLDEDDLDEDDTDEDDTE